VSLIAATTGSYDLALVLGNLLVIIVVARLAAELAERLRVPAVLGEIVAGIIIGPSVLGWIDPIAHLEIADMVLLLG
jgi:Kef-type K+ transport system membrane component KefB